MKVRRVHSTLVFNEGPERWSAPDPTHPAMGDARHAARYPLPGQKPNYSCASQADIYAYLVTCGTTKRAVEQLREIRRAIRELPPNPGDDDE